MDSSPPTVHNLIGNSLDVNKRGSFNIPSSLMFSTSSVRGMERQTDRQTDRQADRQTDRDRKPDIDRDTERETD